MSVRSVAFAVPGKITNLTGGTIYDRRVIDGLRTSGTRVTHIELPGSFPNPTPEDMRRSFDLLAEVTADVPLVVDGLAFGALSTDGVAKIRAPLFPLVHHPLAEESGLSDEAQGHFLQTERDNLRLARHVFVPSPHTAAILSETYSVPEASITIARPGTDRPKLKATPSTPPLILAVGNLAPRKGHDVLLQALAEIKDLDWTAMIVGGPLDPDYTQELRRLHRAFGFDTRVSLAGQVSADALAGLYATATLFALATRYEGYGIVFDEALSHGLPIVSCDAGAVRDTVPPEAGILTLPDAPQAFAQALRRMLSEPVQRQAFAEAALQAGQRLPSWTDTAQHFARVLASEMARHENGTLT
ncbi:MAG: glycosyltransferase family 4 protein [Paracoccaceae bacterium]